MGRRSGLRPMLSQESPCWRSPTAGCSVTEVRSRLSAPCSSGSSMADPVQTPDAPPERASFGDLATQIAGTREQLLDARRNEERVLEKQATTQAPQIERAKTQLGAVAAEGTARTTT